MDNSAIGVLFSGLKPEAGSETSASEFLQGAQTSNDWSIAEAYMCLLLEAIFADDKVDPNEKQYLHALVKRAKTFSGLSDHELSRLNMTVMERRAERPNCVEEACGALPVSMHKTIFALVLDIVLADGDLHPKERDYLDDLMKKMDLSEEAALNIMQVIFDKNRF